MIHFLRNQKNQTIVECEVYGEDLKAWVIIENYSIMLIDLHNKDLHYPFIKAISELSEIRGRWWEQVEFGGEFDSVEQFVEEKFLEVAKNYNLNYITD